MKKLVTIIFMAMFMVLLSFSAQAHIIQKDLYEFIIEANKYFSPASSNFEKPFLYYEQGIDEKERVLSLCSTDGGYLTYSAANGITEIEAVFSDCGLQALRFFNYDGSRYAPTVIPKAIELFESLFKDVFEIGDIENIMKSSSGTYKINESTLVLFDSFFQPLYISPRLGSSVYRSENKVFDFYIIFDNDTLVFESTMGSEDENVYSFIKRINSTALFRNMEVYLTDANKVNIVWSNDVRVDFVTFNYGNRFRAAFDKGLDILSYVVVDVSGYSYWDDVYSDLACLFGELQPELFSDEVIDYIKDVLLYWNRGEETAFLIDLNKYPESLIVLRKDIIVTEQFDYIGRNYNFNYIDDIYWQRGISAIILLDILLINK